MNNSNENIGPRIGIYYGIVIDQDHLEKKIEPIDIAFIVEKITNISPYDLQAIWKIDYDRSQCYKTIVVYNKKYSKIKKCPGYVGGWIPFGDTKKNTKKNI